MENQVRNILIGVATEDIKKGEKVYMDPRAGIVGKINLDSTLGPDVDPTERALFSNGDEA